MDEGMDEGMDGRGDGWTRRWVELPVLDHYPSKVESLFWGTPRAPSMMVCVCTCTYTLTHKHSRMHFPESFTKTQQLGASPPGSHSILGMATS